MDADAVANINYVNSNQHNLTFKLGDLIKVEYEKAAEEGEEELCNDPEVEDALQATNEQNSSQQVADLDESEILDAEDEDYDEDNDEDRGVLRYSYGEENLDEEEEEERLELKNDLSNIIKFLNFLNRLQKENNAFVNEPCSSQSVATQKKMLEDNVSQLSDLMKINLSPSSPKIDATHMELRKTLCVRQELLDRLQVRISEAGDKVGAEAVKRLFSGNNLIIKTQIDELRGILFVKLDSDNMRLRSLDKSQRERRQQRIEKKAQATQILMNTKDAKLLSQIELIQQKTDHLVTLRAELNDKINSIKSRESYQKNNNGALECSPVRKRETPSTPRASSAADFNTFQNVLRENLNLNPEEASPASIISKFRNKLNRKLQTGKMNVNEDSSLHAKQEPVHELIEVVGLEQFNEEELVEEVYYDFNVETQDYVQSTDSSELNTHDISLEDRIIQISQNWYKEPSERELGSEIDNRTAHELEEPNDSYVIQDISELKPVRRDDHCQQMGERETVAFKENEIGFRYGPEDTSSQIETLRDDNTDPEEKTEQQCGQVKGKFAQKSGTGGGGLGTKLLSKESELVFLNKRHTALKQIEELKKRNQARLLNSFIEKQNKCKYSMKRVVESEMKRLDAETKRMRSMLLRIMTDPKRMNQEVFFEVNVSESQERRRTEGADELIDASRPQMNNHSTKKVFEPYLLKKTSAGYQSIILSDPSPSPTNYANLNERNDCPVRKKIKTDAPRNEVGHSEEVKKNEVERNEEESNSGEVEEVYVQFKPNVNQFRASLCRKLKEALVKPGFVGAGTENKRKQPKSVADETCRVKRMRIENGKEKKKKRIVRKMSEQVSGSEIDELVGKRSLIRDLKQQRQQDNVNCNAEVLKFAPKKFSNLVDFVQDLEKQNKLVRVKKKKKRLPNTDECGGKQSEETVHLSEDNEPVVEEFQKNNSKSKILLENLKDQIFQKLNKEQSEKRAAKVKQEIELRLKRRMIKE